MSTYHAPLQEMMFVLHEIAGLPQVASLPGFEEAIRALFANDRARFEQQISSWPEDIRAYAFRLAYQSPNVRR